MTRLITMSIALSTQNNAQVAARLDGLSDIEYVFELLNFHFQVGETAYNIQGTAGIDATGTDTLEKPENGSDITMRFSWIARRTHHDTPQPDTGITEVGRGTSVSFFGNWKPENRIGGITATWRAATTSDWLKDIEELNHATARDDSDRRVTVPVSWGKIALPHDWAKVSVPQAFGAVDIPQAFSRVAPPHGFARVAPPHEFVQVGVDQQFATVSISDEFAGVSVDQQFAQVRGPVNFTLVTVPQLFARVRPERDIIPVTITDPDYFGQDDEAQLVEPPVNELRVPPLTIREVLGYDHARN